MAVTQKTKKMNSNNTGKRRLGSANNLTGATAGVWGAYCGNNGNNSALTNGNWYTCSCGFASKKFPFCLRIRGCNMPPGNPPALRLAA